MAGHHASTWQVGLQRDRSKHPGRDFGWSEASCDYSADEPGDSSPSLFAVSGWLDAVDQLLCPIKQ
jgi:hypothetical protein